MSEEIVAKMVAFTDAIYRSSDKVSLNAAVQEGCIDLGFDVFMLSCHKTVDPDIMLDSTLTNFNPGFLEDYDRLGWFADDFVIQRMREAESAFWCDPTGERPREIQKRSFADFLNAHAFGLGLVVPLEHRNGKSSALSMASATNRQFSPLAALAGKILATSAAGKAEVLGLTSGISVDEAVALRQLTPVQRDILNWISEGKSNPDVATIMGLNERNVRYHVGEILRKLGVATRLQAVAILRGT